MRILHCVLILAFAILLKNVYYLNSLQPSPQVKSYILVAQWPAGFCSGNSRFTCIDSVPTEFTIHGLWPEPNGVPSNEAFDATKLTGITTELNNSWPNLIGDNELFWKYEWNKHGNFSEMGLFEYFKKTLELFEDGGQELKAKLAVENITPNNSKTYKLHAIEAALKKINGNFSCRVICNDRDTGKKEKQILEIRFKYNKNFEKQNDGPSTCGTATTDVMFPLM